MQICVRFENREATRLARRFHELIGLLLHSSRRRAAVFVETSGQSGRLAIFETNTNLHSSPTERQRELPG